MADTDRRGRHHTLTGVDPVSDLPFVTRAFVPDGLPTTVSLTTATWTAVVRAHTALGQLQEHAQRDPRGARSLTRLEAAATSALSGASITVERLLLAEQTDELDAITAATVEALATHPRAAAFDEQVTAAMAAFGADRRTEPAWVPADAEITAAAYVAPPPGPDLDDALGDLHVWAARTQLPDVARAALAHLQLQTLLPATAHNGRVARLLLGSLSAPALPGLVLPVSLQLLRHRQDHEEVLASGREWPAFDDAVVVVADAVADAADDARVRLTRLATAVDTMHRTLTADGVRGTAVAIVDQLADHPAFTVSDLAARHDVAFQTANVAVERLVERGMLTQLTPGHYDRVFGAPAVLDVLDVLDRPGGSALAST